MQLPTENMNHISSTIFPERKLKLFVDSSFWHFFCLTNYKKKKQRKENENEFVLFEKIKCKVNKDQVTK